MIINVPAAAAIPQSCQIHQQPNDNRQRLKFEMRAATSSIFAWVTYLLTLLEYKLVWLG